LVQYHQMMKKSISCRYISKKDGSAVQAHQCKNHKSYEDNLIQFFSRPEDNVYYVLYPSQLHTKKDIKNITVEKY
jgi:hypothetical protein